MSLYIYTNQGLLCTYIQSSLFYSVLHKSRFSVYVFLVFISTLGCRLNFRKKNYSISFFPHLGSSIGVHQRIKLLRKVTFRLQSFSDKPKMNRNKCERFYTCISKIELVNVLLRQKKFLDILLCVKSVHKLLLIFHRQK